MRFLAAHPGPQFSVHDVYVGWVEALRELGQQVLDFNLAERLTFYDAALLETPDRELRKAVSAEQAQKLAVNGLYAALYKTRPDVLFAVSAFFYTPELLDLARSYGTKVVLLHTESPYEDGRQLAIAAHADLNLINDPTNIDDFSRVAPTVYVPHSYRPTIHRPGPGNPDLTADLAFVGTGYASRIEFLEQMDLSGLDVLLAGNWQQLDDGSPLRPFVAHDPEECLDNEQTADVYRSAEIGLNLYRLEAEAEHLADGWAMGPREVEMAACGMFFLRDPRPEGDDVLPMLPTFTTAGEASEQLRYWLGRPAERTELAAQARAAIADRTFTHRAADLMRLLTE
ncbi:glycosyltransferase family protein [Amycolatopsis lurida]|uniref:glycosyltransferase family protein n=1 Tax=Amycolatopsis lurida TaxID=31959 RepID=UPI00364E095F